jgi:hypothetical protein
MKARSSFETKVTTYPRTRLHIHEVFNLLHHRCENLKITKVCKNIPAAQFYPDCLEAVIKNLHETYQCRNVQYKTPDDGQRGCPKHVEFCNKINLDN